MLAVAGGVLMLGPSQTIGGVTVSLPFGWLAATPVKFVRYPSRFLGLVGHAGVLGVGRAESRPYLRRAVGPIPVRAAEP